MDNTGPKPRAHYFDLFMISFVGLLLEINYTRIFSFKLFYYFAYFVIGFALLGFGSGAVVVAVSKRLRRVETQTLLAAGCLISAITIFLSYILIAYVQLSVWQFFSSLAEVRDLLSLSLLLYVSFLSLGLMVALLLSRQSERINKLYFADLLGAGMACVIVIPLMSFLSPPQSVFLCGALLAAVGLRAALRDKNRLAIPCALTAAFLLGCVVLAHVFPDPVPDADKGFDTRTMQHEDHPFSEWGGVFRVDVVRMDPENDSFRSIYHDGLHGSAIYRFDGDISSLTRFDTDVRSFPFTAAPESPRVLIIGAAGGHEILTSLYYGASSITGVELNPVTVSLLTDHFADYTGHLPDFPTVNYVQAEGRAYVAASEETYDLIYFVAPDSFSSMNAATSSAFVLSESYLYTVEAILDCVDHLSEDGVICMEYGEIFYDQKPNRTARYVATAREALARLGIERFDQHVIVLTAPGFFGGSSTILIGKTPFTDVQRADLLRKVGDVPNAVSRHPLGEGISPGLVNRVIDSPKEQLPEVYASYAYEISPVTDNSPFFWHFIRFRDALIPRSDPGAAIIHYDDCVGERILLVLLAASALFAVIGLLVPFAFIGKTWKELPSKAKSFVFFAALGLGFMAFEVALMQKLVLFLGYPTRSISVTLASMLVFAGIGSLVATSYGKRPKRAVQSLFVVIFVIAIGYLFGLDAIVRTFVGASPALRIVVTVALIAPLAFCLGGFMPTGLRVVAGLTERKAEYVAWGWAVNCFFSVLGSVFTTILAISIGFNAVFLFAIAVYAVGVLGLTAIRQE